MREFKILIFESATIYTLATRSISFVEISPLNHEIFDDAMEVGILVAKALLAGAKGAEVLGSLGDIVAEESDDDLSDRLSNWISNTDFKVYFVSHFWLYDYFLWVRISDGRPDFESGSRKNTASGT